MNAIPSGGGYPEPSESPVAEIVTIDRSGSSPILELRVNIAGRDRQVVLRLDALEGHGLSGPAAVEELRGIRAALEDLVELHSRGTGSRLKV